MTEDTAKNRIKELNLIVKRFKEDCEQKGAIIKSQEETIQSHRGLIKSLKTECNDLQEALFIKDGELVECEERLKWDGECFKNKETKAKALLSVINKLVGDTLEGLNN
jgi:chromosome segregation ATPase